MILTGENNNSMQEFLKAESSLVFIIVYTTDRVS